MTHRRACDIFGERFVGPRGTIEAEPERPSVDTVYNLRFREKRGQITGHAGGACPDV